MPPKRGYTDVHLPLPDAMTQKLAHLVASTGRTRSQIVEDAIDATLGHMADETMLAGLHQRIDKLAVSLDSLTAQIVQLVTRMDARLEKVEASQREVYEAMGTLLDQSKAPSNGRGFFSRK